VHGEDLAALAAALLAEGRPVSLGVRGGSMSPFIRNGQQVLLEPLRSPPRPGEVVLRRAPGRRLVLHRVVRVSAGGVVTRGDAAPAEDPPAAPGDILARAVAVSGRRRLHLRPAFGRLLLRGHGLRGGRLAAAPLRPLVRAARALAARLP